MANPRVSEETNEILDRLKKEGDLLRNRGAHSVKSVKIELGKFEGLFDTIANNVMEQTEMMRETLGIERDRVRELERQNELDELKSERVAASPLSPTVESSGERDSGIVALLGNALTGVVGGLGRLAIGGAIGVAGAAVLWQVAKGFIDEKMGEGEADKFLDSTIESIKNFKDSVLVRAPQVFANSLDSLEEYTEKAKGKFDSYSATLDDAQKMYEEQKERFVGEDGVLNKVEKTVDDVQKTVSEIREDIPEMIDKSKELINDANKTMSDVKGVFADVDFPKLRETFGTISRELPGAANKILNFFNNPMAAILPSLTAGLVTGAVARQTGQAIAGLAPGVSRPGSINPTHNLRTAVIGAVGIGLAVFGDKLKEGARDNFGEGFGNIADITIDVFAGAAQGATIGSFFGPKGMLVGALLGIVGTLGMKLYNWLTGTEEKIDSEVQKQIDEKDAEVRAESEANTRRIRDARDEVTVQSQSVAPSMSEEEMRRQGSMTPMPQANRDLQNKVAGFTDTSAFVPGLDPARSAAVEAAANAGDPRIPAIVNYAPTTVNGGPSVGGSTTVQTSNVNAIGGGGGAGSDGSPFPAAGN